MPTRSRTWTVEEVRALPGHGYELIDGQLYVGGLIVPDNDLDAFVPAPPIDSSLLHRRTCMELLQKIGRYTTDHRIGETLPVNREAPLIEGLRGQADIVVVPLDAGRRTRVWPAAGSLLLVIAVVTPRSAHAHRVLDRETYMTAGIPEYWTVDPDAGIIDRWRRGEDRPEMAHDVIEWRPAGSTKSLRIDLNALFTAVRSERLDSEVGAP